VEIRPEPSPQERAAILAALERMLTGEAGVRPSPWWQEGMRENLGEGEQPG